MDDSSVFKLMLAKAVESEPLTFTNFDRAKNVQDQLQEMVKEKLLPFWDTGYLQFIDRSFNITSEFIKFSSMEQRWLSFLMKSLYQKSWNGEEWENDKN